MFELYDNKGKTVSEYRKVVPGGWHEFSVTSNSTQHLLLRVTDNSKSETIRVVSQGSGDGRVAIRYIGQVTDVTMKNKSAKLDPGFIFYLGNQLQYQVFACGYPQYLMTDNPVADKDYAFPLAFHCGETQVCYEGKAYNTVKIGNQCWIRENLDAGTKKNTVQNQTDNGILEKYCYNNVDSNCTIYGGLYQWNEAMQYSTAAGSRGICPSGWHIPKKSEASTLLTYLGGLNVAGGKLKETGYTHWSPPNTGATNASGFTALPSGDVYNGTSRYLHEFVAFYCSTVYSSANADEFMMEYDSAKAYQGNAPKNDAFPIRCLKD